MATCSNIILKTKENKYNVIYVHNDGYLEGVGYILKKYYSKYEDVEKLIQLGDLSCLGRTPESDPKLWDYEYREQLCKSENKQYKHWCERPDYLKCTSYKDRGEKSVDADTYNTFIDMCDSLGGEFNYIFIDNKWKLIDDDNYIIPYNVKLLKDK